MRSGWVAWFAVSLLAPGLALAEEMPLARFDFTPLEIAGVRSVAPRAISPMDLLTIRDLKGLSLSPDGQYVAFVLAQAIHATNNYRSGLFVVRTAPGARPGSLGTAGLPQLDEINQWKLQAPLWSADSRFVMLSTRMNGGARREVWRWQIDGAPPRELTKVPGDVQDFRLSGDGRQLLLTIEAPPDSALALRMAEQGIVYDGSFQLERARPVLNEVLASRPRPTSAWAHDLATGQEREVTDADQNSLPKWVSDIGEDYFNGGTWTGHHLLDAKVSPDGKHVAYRLLAPEAGSQAINQLFTKPVRGGVPAEAAPGAYFTSDYWWGADGRIYYAVYAGDGRANRFFSMAAAGGPSALVLKASANLYQCSLDRSLRYAACAADNARSPGQIVLVDLVHGSMRTLLDYNPEFLNISLSPTVRLDGVNRFGRAWYAHLVKPLHYEPGRRYPLIVTTYTSGDGFLRGASGDENPIHVYALHDFAVLSYDMGNRKNGETTGRFEDFTAAYASQADSIEMAIQRAGELGIADTASVGLTGYSHGMEIVSYEITHTARFRAVSGGAGDQSVYAYYLLGPRIQRDVYARQGQGGWPGGSEAKARWQTADVVGNADRITTPVLNNVPDSEALADLALFGALRDLGKPMDLIIYPDELHHVSQPKHRYQMYERNLDWFRFWLKGEEDPSADKAEQYRRWRELRILQVAQH